MPDPQDTVALAQQEPDGVLPAFLPDGTIEYTPVDEWLWRAHYRDGSYFDEHDERGFHGFAEINQDELEWFELLPQPGYDHLQRHILKLDQGMRLIFFRRRTMEVELDTGLIMGATTWHVLGWQATVQGRNVAHYTFHGAHGVSLATTDPDAL